MLQGYKTVIFNVVVGGLLIVRTLDPNASVPDEEQVTAVLDLLDKVLIAALPFGNLLLRYITRTSIFKQEDKDEGR